MKFDIKKFNKLYHKITLWVFSLGLMIYMLGFNSLDDSKTYNRIDPTKPSKFMVDRLENVGDKQKFPLLLLGGYTINESKNYECRISRGEFEKLTIGDTILVYETHLQTKILTHYAYNNLKPFIAFFGYKLSIYLLGEGLLFCVMLLLFILTSRSIYKTSISRGSS